MLSDLIHSMFDEEGSDTLTYAFLFIYIWFITFLALHYLTDHWKHRDNLYEFPLDPAREPLPKQEAINE